MFVLSLRFCFQYHKIYFSGRNTLNDAEKNHLNGSQLKIRSFYIEDSKGYVKLQWILRPKTVYKRIRIFSRWYFFKWYFTFSSSKMYGHTFLFNFCKFVYYCVHREVCIIYNLHALYISGKHISETSLNCARLSKIFKRRSNAKWI